MYKIITKNTHTKNTRGDTLVEVAFAIAVFSLITVLSIVTMNSGLEMMQSTLEVSMTRNEMDAQAEALRYIHNSYLSERELALETSDGDDTWRDYKDIWDKLTTVSDGGLSNNPTKISAFSANACAVYYKSDEDPAAAIALNHSIFTDKAFIINTRDLDPHSLDTTIVESIKGTTKYTNIFKDTSLYPRVVFKSNTAGLAPTSDDTDDVIFEEQFSGAPVFNRVGTAEGIWVIATRDVTGLSKLGKDPKTATNADLINYTPEFFDFYIRGCWYGAGNNYPSTISTIIRLYNPEYIKEDI